MARKNPVILPCGARLAAAADALELTQAEVAQAITAYMTEKYKGRSRRGEDVGGLEVTPHQYGSWERGEAEPPSRYLEALSKTLRISIESIVGMPDSSGLTDEERIILDRYRCLEHPEMKRVMQVILEAQVAADRRLRGE